jgi:REP element-mobilizing transposase RayT
VIKHRRSGVPPLEGAEQSHSDDSLLAEETASNAAGRRVYDFPREFGYFRPEDAVGNLEGNLPHWRQEGVTYFVTFRLADSLPQVKLLEWLSERDLWLASHPKPWDACTTSAYHKRFTARIEKWLDAGHGSCALARSNVRSVVANALRHFNGVRYGLDAWVVMPNHVHTVVTPLTDCGLSAILHTWKSFTAHAIGKLLPDWRGPFWQKESFDHIVRGPDHLERFRIYIADNPRGLAADTYTLCCNAKES